MRYEHGRAISDIRQMEISYMTNKYHNFIKTKEFESIDAGIDGDVWLPDAMFDFQRDCVKWALKRGRAALFLDTGMGKTITQLAWANAVYRQTGKPVLILAPLCVAQQTEREGVKFGVGCKYHREQPENMTGVIITNYEMAKNFDFTQLAGVVLDESSILKGMNGKYRAFLTDVSKHVPFRLSCTATPSPNDFMELGTQSEWLGIMSQVEMLAMFFIHDGSDTSKWRLKGHGKRKFWEWLSTWAIVLRKPSDIGYSDDGYNLPPIKYHQHTIETETTGGLFVDVAQGLQDRNKARKSTVDDRVAMAASIVNAIDEPVIVWCNLNDESEKLTSKIRDSVQVVGSMKPEIKEEYLLGFTDNKIQKLVTKPKIAGHGMNWQHCRHVVFVGLSDSWEQYYQAIRRCWRFGQTKEVHVYVITADTEGAVVENIRRKELQNHEMGGQMVSRMREFTRKQIKGATIEKTEYSPNQKMILPSFIRAA